ncbi:MAG TPA: hypothetical protein PKD75_13220 [Tepidiformaceae bacterium]|nr:hypothetical protein [Tepidiformaceae bacterium]
MTRESTGNAIPRPAACVPLLDAAGRALLFKGKEPGSETGSWSM